MHIKKISITNIIFFLILIAIFRPAYVPFEWLNWLYRGAQAAGLLYLITATSVRKLKNSRLIFLFGVYYFVLLLNTLANNGSLIELINEVLTMLLVVLWIHNMAERKPESCVDQLMMLFSALVLANMLTIILFPDGLYQSADAIISARHGWLLGHQSLFSMYAGPTICISALYWNNHSSLMSRLLSLFIIAICVIQTIMLGSANNIMCILIIAMCVIGMYLLRTQKFKFTLVYIAITALVLMICVFQATGFMEAFVTKYLNRSASFTGRTIIWSRVINIIKNSLVVGTGIQDNQYAYSQIGVSHAHNQYLQCLYLGGLVLLVVFIIILYNSFKNLENVANSFAGKVMIAAVISLMIQMIFEVYFHHTMGRVLIVLSFYFGKLCLPEKHHKRRRIRWHKLKE